MHYSYTTGLSTILIVLQRLCYWRSNSKNPVSLRSDGKGEGKKGKHSKVIFFPHSFFSFASLTYKIFCLLPVNPPLSPVPGACASKASSASITELKLLQFLGLDQSTAPLFLSFSPSIMGSLAVCFSFLLKSTKAHPLQDPISQSVITLAWT